MSVKKQLGLFLIICLPITWMLTGVTVIIYKDAYVTSPVANALSMLSAFIPAIAAIICKKMSKESIRSLNLLPKFEGNGKTYAFAVLGALFISIWDIPLVTLLFFPQIGNLHQDASITIIISGLLLYTAVGAVHFFVLMGEEIGWMGFLFPKLEELWGTNISIILTGIIRGLWHMGMFINSESFAKNVMVICFTNIVFGTFLVLLTKRSGSVVPAAVCHGLNNTIPSVMHNFIIINETTYKEYELIINIIVYVPCLIFTAVCWYILVKKYKKNPYKY